MFPRLHHGNALPSLRDGTAQDRRAASSRGVPAVFPSWLLSSAGQTLIPVLLALVALGLIAAAGWAAGLFGPVAGGPLLTAVAVVAVLVAVGFIAIAVAMNRMQTAEAPGGETVPPATTPTHAPGAAHDEGFSPWRSAIISLVSALAATLGFLGIGGWAISQFDNGIQLPMLIVLALVALLGGIAFVVIAFGIFGLKDRTQALGLPAGSVQAIIALSLILLFVTMTVFLVVQIKDADAAKPSVDIAKQVLTVLGTLVTAVSSFYFGSRSTSDAVRGTQLQPPDPGGSRTGGSAGGSAAGGVGGGGTAPSGSGGQQAPPASGGTSGQAGNGTQSPAGDGGTAAPGTVVVNTGGATPSAGATGEGRASEQAAAGSQTPPSTPAAGTATSPTPGPAAAGATGGAAGDGSDAGTSTGPGGTAGAADGGSDAAVG